MDHSLEEMRDTMASFGPSSSGNHQFSIDEGFAEESQHQGESGRAELDPTAAHFQQWIQAQRPEIRAEVAYEILRTLRTSQINTIVERLMPLLHMDPIEKLPAEVTLMIFSYLDASTLLTASLSSQTWRERILDPRLWQELYRAEGWRVDAKAVKAFEAEHAHILRQEFKRARGQMRHSIGKGQPLSKRRATSEWLDSKPRRISADVAHWREQHGMVEADTDAPVDVDHEMSDVPANAFESPSRPNKRASNDSSDEMNYGQDCDPSTQRDHALRMELLVEDGQGDIKLNWPHLYKQRHKLEENWLKGRFTNFQLPHPKYPHEAHTECVYTIQFHGKWLVSGSRDKSLRIWDMETRRLCGRPLTGHSQSVLCLQFDPSEDEDVIISGSSDTSVIVWKFSTGKKLYVIPSAHEESVLNLKFDKRYLVTCSKDKRIKIWNRNAMTAADPDYPRMPDKNRHTKNPVRVPSYIVDVTAVEPSMLEARIADGYIKSLQPYMHIMTLDGHAAAVNAIQINGDLIVSASGDRLIRVWSIRKSVCLRVLPGHMKGIACVQFDNKRIVSGSSDNTVRVYDLVSGTEAAVLLGHRNLVRTVQAGFGDAPGSEEDDYAAAQEAERACIEDLENGRLANDRHALRRIRMGEGGSSRSGVGSRLPPGGGGSKWGRIVSGSYDESIIIWKKGPKGEWVMGQTLRQDAAVRASVESDGAQEAPSNGMLRDRSRHPRTAPASTMSPSQIGQQAVNTSMAGLQSGIQNVMDISRSLQDSRNQPTNVNIGDSDDALERSTMSATPAAARQGNAGVQQAAMGTIDQSMADPDQDLARGNPATLAQPSSSVHVEPPSSTGALYNRSVTSIHTSTVTHGEGQNPGTSVPPMVQVHTSIVHPAGLQAQTQPQPQAQQTPSYVNPHPAVPHQPIVNANANDQANVAANTHANQQHAARVFKLQFDARRIVCCSQDSRIIGWDFANGDPEIEAACQFFIGP